MDIQHRRGSAFRHAMRADQQRQESAGSSPFHRERFLGRLAVTTAGLARLKRWTQIRNPLRLGKIGWGSFVRVGDL